MSVVDCVGAFLVPAALTAILKGNWETYFTGFAIGCMGINAGKWSYRKFKEWK